MRKEYQIQENIRFISDGKGRMDTVDLSQWENPCAAGSYVQGIDYRGYMPSIVMGSRGFADAYNAAIRRHMQQIELRHLNRAKLLFESEPGPHDWFQPRERLWFCELNGVRFAVVDSNPDTALSDVDEAWRAK